MGCDIHMHIEVKIDNRWEHYGVPSVKRSYQLFEKLAGVRGDEINALIAPQGIPADATRLTMIDFERWGRDAHTPSWIDTEKIMELEEWLSNLPGTFMDNDLEYTILNTYLFGNSFTGYHKYPDENYQKVQDVRFIFWFDN